MAGQTRDQDDLELILELIDHIGRRLAATTPQTFAEDRDEIDLTAFRLAHIGEAAKRLSSELKDRHTNIPWRAMTDMRNVLAHDYGGLRPELIWAAATTRLNELAAVCRTELAGAR